MKTKYLEQESNVESTGTAFLTLPLKKELGRLAKIEDYFSLY